LANCISLLLNAWWLYVSLLLQGQLSLSISQGA
jgi:hypothetical protein